MIQDVIRAEITRLEDNLYQNHLSDLGDIIQPDPAKIASLCDMIEFLEDRLYELAIPLRVVS